MESLFSNSEERESQQLQERQRQTKEACIGYFESIKKHSTSLQNLRFTCTGTEVGFKRPFQIYFGEEHDTFRQKLFYNMNQLQVQPDKEDLHEYSLDHDSQDLKKSFKYYTGKEPQTYKRELIYYMDGLKMQIDKTTLHDSEWQMKETRALDASMVSEESTDDNRSPEQQDRSSSSGYDADTKRARVDKDVSEVEYAAVRPSYDKDTLTEGLGFENQNDVENLFVLNKAKEITPSLYNIDEMGKDLLSDDMIISEEELKCEAEKRLKVKQRKSPLSYHGFVYGLTQFEESQKLLLKRREVNLKKHLEQAHLEN
ncbi:hypothetical protein Tco_1561837 [Tanacetum coccineum]